MGIETIILIQAALITSFIVMLIEAAGLVEWFKRKLFYIAYTKESNYKPFNIPIIQCSKCLTFWIILGFLYYSGVTLLWIPFIASAYVMLALALTKYIIYL